VRWREKFELEKKNICDAIQKEVLVGTDGGGAGLAFRSGEEREERSRAAKRVFESGAHKRHRSDF
jgi:hypothetical protein